MPGHFSLCRMITNLRMKRSRTQLSVPFLRPEGQIQSTGDTLLAHGGIRTREKRALQAQRSKRSSGIHFGISSCTAVKDQLKHRLEVTLQAYFTILHTVFHGKKAAKTHGAYNFSINRTIICAVLKYSSRFENRVLQAKTEYFLRPAKSRENNKKALE